MNATGTKTRLLHAAAFGLLLIVLWELFAYSEPPIPSSVLILEAFGIQIVRDALLSALLQALYAILTGYALATIVGVPVGVAMGLSRTLEEVLDPYVNGLYAVPLAAIVPMLIIWFGTGFQVRVVAVFFYAFFPITINTLEGAKTTPSGLYEVAESFGANWYFKVKNVVIPHEIPYILTGLQLGSGRAVKGLVITELVISVTGFGLIIAEWSTAFRLEGVFSVVLLLMFLGVAFVGILKLIATYAVPWRSAA